MSEVDLSLAGNFLSSADKLNDLEDFLTEQGDEQSMTLAMTALFERVKNVLNMNKDVYDQLSNINKFYLVRGALPEKEQDLRAYILERFFKFIS